MILESWGMFGPVTLACLGASLLAGLAYGVRWRAADEGPLRSALKTGSIVALGLAAIAAGLPIWSVAALFLCALGDYCLSRSGERWFLAGLAAFLSGHLVYLGGFLWAGAPVAPPVWAIAAVLAVAALILLRLWPGLGTMRGPVSLYVAVIAGMALAALGQREAAPALVAGALVFMASDTILAFDMFRPSADARIRSLASAAVWATYLLAQFLLFQGMVQLGA
ncbi:lysoplasmalogenase [Oceanomicrobium pacificus]|uniref:Lysoplasmalogenase n=1 Tax=Oceanomicrobium pacificus TaxID=2692916 RepID=A0A6B0U3N5_9RHOB|nr:lysoplasmalogenase [Oceanomicrobium pacificus]MXU65561.1 lysoplasmalogenase [Oceanomicrobium pacificus]